MTLVLLRYIVLISTIAWLQHICQIECIVGYALQERLNILVGFTLGTQDSIPRVICVSMSDPSNTIQFRWDLFPYPKEMHTTWFGISSGLRYLHTVACRWSKQLDLPWHTTSKTSIKPSVLYTYCIQVWCAYVTLNVIDACMWMSSCTWFMPLAWFRKLQTCIKASDARHPDASASALH